MITKKYGVIVDYEGYVFFRFGEHGENCGSEPLLDTKRNPTREAAKKRIMDVFTRNGVKTFEVIEGR